MLQNIGFFKRVLFIGGNIFVSRVVDIGRFSQEDHWTFLIGGLLHGSHRMKGEAFS